MQIGGGPHLISKYTIERIDCVAMHKDRRDQDSSCVRISCCWGPVQTIGRGTKTVLADEGEEVLGGPPDETYATEVVGTVNHSDIPRG